MEKESDMLDGMALRRRAERRLGERAKDREDLEGMSPRDMAELIHELRVHQIELSVQNEELRRVQEELQQARNHYACLYDFAPVGYFTVDERGAVVKANLTAAALLGWPRAVLPGRMFSSFIQSEDQDEWYFHRKRLVETGKFQSVQLRLVKNDGSSFYAVLECMRNGDGDAAPGWINLAAVDITALKRAEDALRQMNETLELRVAERTAEVEQRSLKLRKLALDMSNTEERERRRIAILLHDDLQQRIASLGYLLWGLLPWDKMDETVNAKRAVLEKAIKECLDVSRDLSLDLSPPVLRQNGLVAALAWLAGDMESRHGITVTVRAGKATDPESEALSSALFHAIKELLFNVIKHARVRSAVVDVRRNGGMIVISVSDSGKGFDAGAYRAGQKNGDGSGLFGIEEKIQVLGGRVDIASEPGKGCRVTVSLPIGDPAPGKAPREPSLARAAPAIAFTEVMRSAGNKKIRILIADDHPMMREGLASLLKDMDGLEVIAQAGDGREVVSLARRLHPDLILMDVSMPGLDGIEATSRINRDQPDIYIVGLSMHDDQTTRERMRQAGASDYLCKSNLTESLTTSIERAAAKRERRSG